MNRRYTFVFLVALATTAFGQRPRLCQMDEYLRKQKTQVTTDSIRHFFASMSREASESYRFEYHKDDVDTIKYELAFRADDNSGRRSPIQEMARFYNKGTQAEYHHGYRDAEAPSNSDMKTLDIAELMVVRSTASTTTGQSNQRLRQLENYLQEQGLIKMIDHKPNASKTKKRHNKGGQLTTPPSQAILDSISTVFTNLSKEAMESHLYENHADGTDTIEYALVFSDTEAVNFTYKKNSANQVRGLYTHTYEREEMKPSDAIAAKQWRIDIRSMNTMRYGSRIVTPDFYLELRGDTLHSYLPYLGQAQVSPMLSPSIGLNFEEPVLKYKESLPKSKKYTQIDIDVRTREDSYHYMIQIYDSGESTIRVRSLNRDPISFDGTMTTSY